MTNKALTANQRLEPRGAVNTRQRVTRFVGENLAWFMALVLFINSATTLRAFLFPANLRNVLMHSTVTATLMIGVAVCLIAGYFDMAMESTLILTGCVGAWLCSGAENASGLQLNPLLAVAIQLVLGAALGAFQGFCITKLNMVPFITSLALRITFAGFVLVMMQKGTIAPMPDAYRWLATGEIGPLPVTVLAVLLLYVAVHWMLTNTRLGRSIYAVGGNRQSAKNAGVNDDRVTIYVFMLSGLMAAIAGWITVGRLDAANYQMSVNVTFEVIAAAVLGGIMMGGGRGHLLRAISGILMMVLIVNYLNLSHVSPWYVDLARGLAIFGATVLDSRMGRR